MEPWQDSNLGWDQVLETVEVIRVNGQFLIKTQSTTSFHSGAAQKNECGLSTSKFMICHYFNPAMMPEKYKFHQPSSFFRFCDKPTETFPIILSVMSSIPCFSKNFLISSLVGDLDGVSCPLDFWSSFKLFICIPYWFLDIYLGIIKLKITTISPIYIYVSIQPFSPALRNKIRTGGNR